MSFGFVSTCPKNRNEAAFEGNEGVHIMADFIIIAAATAKEHSPANSSQGL